jgi:hypothetical protein
MVKVPALSLKHVRRGGWGHSQGTRWNNTFSIKLDPSDSSTLYPTAKHRVHIELGAIARQCDVARCDLPSTT